MSRELYAYIDTPEPVLRSDLDETVEVLGWSYRAFEDISSFRLDTGEYIRSGELLLWNEEPDLEREIDGVIARGDQSLLDRLYEDDLVGIVTVDHEVPFTADPEMLEDLSRRPVDASVVDRIARAKQFYSVRTSAVRNDFSLEVQTAVGTFLAIARYGVLEDPQEGTFDNFARELVERDDDETIDEGKKPWWKFW